MTEEEAAETSETRRTRTAGIQYPGASLPTVLNLLATINELGGRATVGRLAARVGRSEETAEFKRLIISARVYGLAEWDNDAKSVLRLTDEGQKAVRGEDREAVLQRAFLRPDVFRGVARNLGGRSIPDDDGLVEVFTIAGVAPSGAGLAAANFVASAEAAGALEQEGSRRLLSADLPFPTEEVGATRPAATAARPAPASRAVATSRAGSGSSPTGATGGGAQPQPSRSTVAGSPTIEVKLDVSGWSVDQVLELVRKLRSSSGDA